MAEGGTYDRGLLTGGVVRLFATIKSGQFLGYSRTRVNQDFQNTPYFIPWVVKANPERFVYNVLKPEIVNRVVEWVNHVQSTISYNNSNPKIDSTKTYKPDNTKTENTNTENTNTENTNTENTNTENTNTENTNTENTNTENTNTENTNTENTNEFNTTIFLVEGIFAFVVFLFCGYRWYKARQSNLATK